MRKLWFRFNGKACSHRRRCRGFKADGLSHACQSYLPQSPKSCNNPQILFLPCPLIFQGILRAKIMSTCSMQKAQSYLPTRQSVLVTAPRECQREGGRSACTREG